MKYRLDGNLAYNISDEKIQSDFSADSLRSSAVPDIPYELPYFPQQREAEIKREKRRIARQEAARDAAIRKIHRNIGAEHLKTVVYCVVCIAMMVGMFAFLLLRQSQIVEQNFQNTRIKNQINELKIENANQYDQILSQVNLTEIELEAAKLYGLRKPAQAQRIHVNSPKVDRVICYKQNDISALADKDVSETVNSNIFDAAQIELYMKQLRLQD